MRIIVLSLFALIGFSAFSQPNTDIYLFRIDQPGAKKPINISNNPGYDNQPSFWEDSESILYARTVDGQTEIARYFIGSGETKIITKTNQGSEYSPLQIPGSNDISSIRLDEDGLQLLYRYDLKGNSKVLVPALKIGYHAWINENEMATFVLGEPATLQHINLKTGEATILKENIGRSMHSFKPFKGFSYVDKSKESSRIVLNNMEKKFDDGIIDLPAGVEDYCWSSDFLKIFTSQGSNIMISVEGQPWKPFIDLSLYDLTGAISRMACSPDGKWLAVVVEASNK